MTKQAIIERTIKAMDQLPEDKAEEILNFADFVKKRHEEQILKLGMEKLTSDSKAFNFLNDEEELYSLSDLKERYND